MRRVIISVSLPGDIVMWIDQIAMKEGKDRSSIIREALYYYKNAKESPAPTEKRVASGAQKPQSTKELGEPNMEKQVFEAIENLKKETLKQEEKEEDPQPQPSKPKWAYADVYRTWDTEVLEKFLNMNLNEETKKAISEELERREG